MKENARIERIYLNGYENRNKFRPISDYINEKYVTPTPDKELSQEAREVISDCSAVDMAMGAESVKSKYLIIGSLIGIAGTIVLLQIKKKFKKVKA